MQLLVSFSCSFQRAVEYCTYHRIQLSPQLQCRVLFRQSAKMWQHLARTIPDIQNIATDTKALHCGRSPASTPLQLTFPATTKPVELSSILAHFGPVDSIFAIEPYRRSARLMRPEITSLFVCADFGISQVADTDWGGFWSTSSSG